jgi:predicted Zn-dependent protease
MLPKAVACVAALALAIAPSIVRADPAELQIGQQVLQQYQRQGLIVRGNHADAVVQAVGRRLAAVARGLYDEPFRFYVVHQAAPNAFSVPGGYLFVTDALVKVVHTEDELACVTGHEMGHTIHHDVMNRLKREQQAGTWLALGQLLLGGRIASIASLALDIQALHFDREIETAADLTGADLCAKAGFNPFGLVWMMETFESLPGQTKTMEMFSDHPREDHRISDLEAHFRAHPELFAKFRNDKSTAKPLPR